MKYLECIALLNVGLQVLRDGERVQVPVMRLKEIQTILARLVDRSDEFEEDCTILLRINDLLLSVQALMERKPSSDGMQFLTYDMKHMYATALKELREKIARLAFGFYKQHDFEVTPQIIPVMRDVVEYGF
jgi:hypothetical protein